ncbi:MAG: calcium/sodium antiporter [Clostridia bacterium]|nr:calcium/sodium antiporter [Clostridia bacterium]
MILFYLLALVVGFIALVKGADMFVDGSSGLAKNFGVPALVIGLTLVALGTSAPELAVSVSASLRGSNEIALSNVLGSNLFNLLGVLGVCAVISPISVEKNVLKRDFPFSVVTTGLILLAVCTYAFFSGHSISYDMEKDISQISRFMGLILIIVFTAYICYLIHSAKNDNSQSSDKNKQPVIKCVLFIVLGLSLIVAGGQAVVYGAKEIARAFGMTETLIGLTIVAIGTSLPELVTSVVAARKGETGLAVGNVIGSNIFNLMFILGICAFIRPVAVNMASVFDMAILLCISILTLMFSHSGGKINRAEGIIMLGIYVSDVVFAILR